MCPATCMIYPTAPIPKAQMQPNAFEVDYFLPYATCRKGKLWKVFQNCQLFMFENRYRKGAQ